jgi:uncharacterized protein YfdQ (DUF2303 family)
MEDIHNTPDMSGPTAKLIERLAVEGGKVQQVAIKTKGLGDGLPGEIPVVWDAKEQRLVSVRQEVEGYRQTPQRRKGCAKVTTLQSLIDLADRHKDEHSVLFGKTEWPNPSLTAVLDYHQKDHAARNNTHTIVYNFPVTEELKAWIDGNATPVSQGEFAAFLEEHAPELASPTEEERKHYEPLFNVRFAEPMELLQLSRHLEIHVNSSFKQAETLKSGERVVQFTEDHHDGHGEKVDVPGLFMVSLPAFLDGEPVRMPVRLRYRAKGGGQVVWFYQLYRWDAFLRERVKADLDLAASKTELPAYEGSPET